MSCNQQPSDANLSGVAVNGSNWYHAYACIGFLYLLPLLEGGEQTTHRRIRAAVFGYISWLNDTAKRRSVISVRFAHLNGVWHRHGASKCVSSLNT